MSSHQQGSQFSKGCSDGLCGPCAKLFGTLLQLPCFRISFLLVQKTFHAFHFLDFNFEIYNLDLLFMIDIVVLFNRTCPILLDNYYFLLFYPLPKGQKEIITRYRKMYVTDIKMRGRFHKDMYYI